MYEYKQDVSAVGDVNVRRALTQFDTGDGRSFSQRSAVAVMLGENPLQFIDKLLLHTPGGSTAWPLSLTTDTARNTNICFYQTELSFTLMFWSQYQNHDQLFSR